MTTETSAAHVRFLPAAQDLLTLMEEQAREWPGASRLELHDGYELVVSRVGKDFAPSYRLMHDICVTFHMREADALHYVATMLARESYAAIQVASMAVGS